MAFQQRITIIKVKNRKNIVLIKICTNNNPLSIWHSCLYEVLLRDTWLAYQNKSPNWAEFFLNRETLH